MIEKSVQSGERKFNGPCTKGREEIWFRAWFDMGSEMMSSGTSFSLLASQLYFLRQVSLHGINSFIISASGLVRNITHFYPWSFSQRLFGFNGSRAHLWITESAQGNEGFYWPNLELDVYSAHQNIVIWGWDKMAHQLELAAISASRANRWSVESIKVYGVLLTETDSLIWI